MIPSNTPPDGDFVRYVERLTSTKVDPLVRQFMLTPAAGDGATPIDVTNPAASNAPADKAILESLSETPFLTHVKWVVGAWIATQFLARLIPGLGFLFIPALLAYAGWVLFKVNRDTSGALFQRVQQLTDAAATSAAAEIKKARQAEQKTPP